MECTPELCREDQRLSGDYYKDPQHIEDLVRDALSSRALSLLQLAVEILRREAKIAQDAEHVAEMQRAIDA